MENVNSPHSITLNLQIQDVLLGIGIIKSALNVQRIGLRMLMVLVFLSVIIVLPMMHQELAPLVIMDMTSLMENASSQHSTTLSLLTQDVVNGIGTIRSVLNALKIGFSTLMVLVYQLVNNVQLMTQMEPVALATKDMT